eukprot:39359_1
MASEEQRDLRKGLLKKDKLELVKILKSKKQPTNGGKADLVDRILAYDEKHGGKMSRKATQQADGDEYEQEEEEEEEEYEEEVLSDLNNIVYSKPIHKKPKIDFGLQINTGDNNNNNNNK